jgi:hypothetical protein
LYAREIILFLYDHVLAVGGSLMAVLGMVAHANQLSGEATEKKKTVRKRKRPTLKEIKGGTKSEPKKVRSDISNSNENSNSKT